MSEGKKEIVPTPSGAAAVEILQSRTLEKFELKTGPNIWDVIDFKYVKVQELKDEINLMGKMSDFADVSDEVLKLEAEEVLLWADRDEKYGKNWVICFTKEAEEELMAEFKQKEAAELAAKKAAEEEEARRLAEEEAARNVVYEDKPLIPQPYASKFQEETFDEVAALTPQTERPLRALTVTRTVESLKKSVRFGSRDAEQFPSVDLRSHKEPVFDLNCNEHTIGLQAGPSMKTTTSQTTWFRKTNKAVQYQSLTTDHGDTITPSTEAIGVGTSTKPSGEAKVEDESKAMEAFFRKVMPMVERALQQNETVDIFRNVFKVLTDEDAALSKQSENELKEIRTFSDINYSKNKVLSAIDWVPKKKGMVAVSAVDNISFDQRVSESGLVHTSYILLWDFSDLIRPALKLQSPHEIFTFRFNPEEPNYVAAGSMSGQVMFWNVTEALTIIANKKNRSLKRARRSSTVVEEKDEEDENHAALLAPMKPTAMSYIDFSHRRLVADLVWLPTDMHINFRGQLLSEEYRPKQPYQFMTVAGDGLCLFWDVRFQEIAEGKLPYIAKPRLNPSEKPNKDGSIPQAPWVPLFRMALKRLEGVGELSLSKVVINLQQTSLQITKPEQDPQESDMLDDLRSKVFVATEEGDIVFADWRAKSMAAANATGGKDDEDDGPEADFVQWMEWDHPRPCVALEKSPFFPDMVLSVGDWNFQLWKLDCQTPIFSSPLSKVYLTSGCWSPTRPGVLFLGKGDGDVDVWDFTDSSYSPSQSVKTAPSKITSMEFLPVPPNVITKQQLLAVGDVNGNLHVFEMPRNLWRPVPNEMGIMETFLQREIMKVGYVVNRFEIRQEEQTSMEAEVEFVPDADKPKTAEMDDGRTDAGESATSEIEEIEPELLEQNEKYTELESELMEKLELGPEDLSSSYLEEKELEALQEEDDDDDPMNRTIASQKSRARTEKSFKG